jgi:hypothetical protein
LKPALGKQFCETLSRKKPFTKKGLGEWFKEQALSSSPSTAKKGGEAEGRLRHRGEATRRQRQRL